MAQIEKQPLLSLCIPIYNRLAYLERQLARMLEDKELFEEQIQLIISDNCSTDDLRSCCDKYRDQGLSLQYHRNETNIGPDGNFEWCFHHADGKYVWLLGSDDVPVPGMLKSVISVLESGDYGLVSLSLSPRQETIIHYSKDDILAPVNVWITFISVNIISTVTLRSLDLKPYIGSFMIQVPAYINAALCARQNAVLYLDELFEKDSDGANNGGYNLFKVFVENLFGIYKQFVDKELLPIRTFENIKRQEYKTWLIEYVMSLLILRRPQRKNFDLANSWTILLRHYGSKPYFYYYTVWALFKAFIRNIWIRNTFLKCLMLFSPLAYLRKIGVGDII